MWHWYTCFVLYVTSALKSKSRMDSPICQASSAVSDGPSESHPELHLPNIFTFPNGLPQTLFCSHTLSAEESAQMWGVHLIWHVWQIEKLNYTQIVPAASSVDPSPPGSLQVGRLPSSLVRRHLGDSLGSQVTDLNLLEVTSEVWEWHPVEKCYSYNVLNPLNKVTIGRFYDFFCLISDMTIQYKCNYW